MGEVIGAICQNGGLVCQFTVLTLPGLFTVIIATGLTAFFSYQVFATRKNRSNNHVLHALWEETRIVNYDCLQWVKNFDGEKINQQIRDNNSYRPYTVNYRTSSKAIELLLSEMHGVKPSLIKKGFMYRYDDNNAVAIIEYISSDTWHELSQTQKFSVIEDAHRAMKALLASSKALHRELSKTLKVKCDEDVEKARVPQNETRV